METITKKKFNKRAFISVAMFVSGLALPFSGLMNHLLQFEPMTTARHFWMSVHDASGILFAAFAITHVIFNWRSLLHYAKRIKGIAFSSEAITAFLLVLLVVGLISLHAFHT
jgi:hypothetical protein